MKPRSWHAPRLRSGQAVYAAAAYTAIAIAMTWPLATVVGRVLPHDFGDPLREHYEREHK